MSQSYLFENVKRPSTRYQGSKHKFLPWIMEKLKGLEFETCLDAFGGTGVVSHAMKLSGKSVTYNDIQPFNYFIGKAIIENDEIRFENSEKILKKSSVNYSDFIEKTFKNIYFTDEENRWLDVVTQNILKVRNESKRSLAFYALFQSCLAKRPYNLFHRANLYMRTQKVQRSFGNKATWDKPFEDHFKYFLEEVNKCVFSGEKKCFALCSNATEIKGKYDLVYIDSPYINKSGTGVDYGDFYHFLNGLVDYKNWATKLDTSRKHMPLIRQDDPWSDKDRIANAFDQLFKNFKDSIIAVSYRSDGIPSEKELIKILSQYKRVSKHEYGRYKYVLSTNNKSQEVLLIGK